MKLLIAMLFLFLMVPQTAHAYDIQWGTNKFYNINVICTTPSNNHKLEHEAEAFINKTVSAYKDEILSKHLDTIYLCKELTRNSMEWYAGTYDIKSRSVFIEVGDYKFADADWVFHHEFSSIIFHSYFSIKYLTRWVKNSMFKYGYPDGDLLTEDWVPNPSLQSTGALFKYCTTDVENDFNVVTAYYLTDGNRRTLDEAAYKFQKIRNKKDIVAEIYQSILK